MDSRLPDLLQKYPIIWDRSRKDFRNNNKKQNAFQALATELNAPVEVVMARYKAIREKYRKEKTRIFEGSKSGAGAAEVDTWELFNSLSFFDGVMLQRKRTTNMNQPSTSSALAPLLYSDLTLDLDHIYVENQEEPVFSPTVSDTLSEESETRAGLCVTPQPPSKRKKTNTNINSSIESMITAISDTAASLRMPPVTVSETRYDWLGKFIAATLNGLEEKEAEVKCNKILEVLTNKM